MSETIAAISTALYPAGIGVVRLSGDDAFLIADKIWRSNSGKKLMDMPANTAAVGIVHDEETDIDECVALVFKEPHSFTGENVVELSCHGGVYILRRVLEAAIKSGARPAGPGEFTKRAFLNGKMDLTEAEAVMDLISAQGETAARAALSQHKGALFKEIEKVKKNLIELSADITAWVDFPDEDVPSLEPQTLINTLSDVKNELEKLRDNYSRGRIIKEGVETVIIGRPNVGKSTLMNAISGYEKSIVTEIPGTTRDVVEDSVAFAGVVLKLWDTAGIRETDDPVESIGVKRAKEKLDDAQLILAVFDGSKELTDDDKKIIEQTSGRNVIAVVNKCDLPLKIDKSYIENRIKPIVYISAGKQEGIENSKRR
jgi:tRNA modification GTPase trmE